MTTSLHSGTIPKISGEKTFVLRFVLQQFNKNSVEGTTVALQDLAMENKKPLLLLNLAELKATSSIRTTMRPIEC